MDSQQFQRVSSPNLYPVVKPNNRFVESQIFQQAHALNSRYSGSVAIAEDANVFTDYRPKCTKNIPSGQQYASRQWLQHNAENMIKLSRERQAKSVGAGYMHAATVTQGIASVKCDVNKCAYYPGGDHQNSVGIDRMDAAPDLFGTFSFNMQMPAQNPKNTITTRYEGGRNSVRG